MSLLRYFRSAYVFVRVVQVPCRGKNLLLPDSSTPTIDIGPVFKADDGGGLDVRQRRTTQKTGSISWFGACVPWSTDGKHIREEELDSAILLGRVMVAEDCGKFIGWLRWNLLWDNTPFMNMLFILEQYRSCGYGRTMTAYWEKQMKSKGYDLVMTSSLSDETAQHFYRKLNYVDSGALLLPGEPMEIIFVKKI